METFITTAGALGFVKAVVDLVKYVRARDTNGYVTQIAVWLAGIGTTVLLSLSDFGESIDVGGVALDVASGATLILAGLGLGSAAMLANEVKSAIDRSDTAVKPELIPHGPEATVPE